MPDPGLAPNFGAVGWGGGEGIDNGQRPGLNVCLGAGRLQMGRDNLYRKNNGQAHDGGGEGLLSAPRLISRPGSED